MPGSGDRLEAALLNALGKTRKTYECVSMEQLIDKAGLSALQPPEARFGEGLACTSVLHAAAVDLARVERGQRVGH